MSMYVTDNETTGLQWDIHPGSAYATSQVEDVENNGYNNIELVSPTRADIATDAANAEICTEYWYLSATAITCVETNVKVKRSRNTGDSAHDIILDFYNTYQMHAMIGRIADTADLTLQLGI